MKILNRANRIYDTSRFGQPEIRVRHRPAVGKKSACYILRCGCCSETLKTYYSDDGLEIGGVHGAIKDCARFCCHCSTMAGDENRSNVRLGKTFGHGDAPKRPGSSRTVATQFVLFWPKIRLRTRARLGHNRLLN
jgi:hypothetical protein